METINSTANTEIKKLTGLQKNSILNTAKTLYREVYRRCNALEERISKARTEAELALEKKTAKLREELEELRSSKEDYISRKVEELLNGYDIDDIVTYEIKESETGKKSLFVNFKYPDTIYPVAVETEREADIDEDMPGEYAELPMPEEQPEVTADDVPFSDDEPEYDGAGFSTEDGLAEGEPAELAEKFEMPFEKADSEAIDHQFGSDFDADVETAEEYAERQAGAVAPVEDEDIEAQADELEAMLDDPSTGDDDDPWQDDDEPEDCDGTQHADKDDEFDIF